MITTDQLTQIDVRCWQRDGSLAPGNTFFCNWRHGSGESSSIHVSVESGQVVLKYCWGEPGGKWRLLSYPVELAWTGCNYGGRRPWFRCPAGGCARRVAILYGGSFYPCRKCHRLLYQSQLKNEMQRGMGKEQAIRMRLGGSPNLILPFPPRPKGMHWNTYLRLFQTSQASETIWLRRMASHAIGWGPCLLSGGR